MSGKAGSATPRVTRDELAAALRTAEEHLRQGEERYDIAMRAINDGVCDWNVAEGTIYYSERVHAATGMTPDAISTPDWRARIHPYDLPAYDAAVVDHFKQRTDRCWLTGSRRSRWAKCSSRARRPRCRCLR